MIQFHYIPETSSTNVLLWEMLRKAKLQEGYVIHTGFQQSGKGQRGNNWEAEADKNLLFSLFLQPNHLPFDELFYLSQVVSLGIKEALDKYVDGVCIKWPNDIYHYDRKIAGILIENSLQGNQIKTVVGVGLNVNQKEFHSDAPNPISLAQITGLDFEPEVLLKEVVEKIMKYYRLSNQQEIRNNYAKHLYRNEGYYTYAHEQGQFEARIDDVLPDGQLILETPQGEKKAFYFKEVQFR